MKRKRLTREQSRDQTRERLLDAAAERFAKKGFVGASVEDIAAQAGYTRGAFYSNFGSKSELLVELLRRDHETTLSDLNAIFTPEATREQMEARVLAYYSRRPLDKDSLLWAEAKLLASRDARFRHAFAAFMKEQHDAMTAYIEEFSARVGTPVPLSAPVLTLGLIGLCDGMLSLASADPHSVTPDIVEKVLAGFFARVVFGRDA